MDQRRLAGICLPKPDVMQDQVLIYTGQPQGRQRAPAKNYRMKGRSPHHKTSSNYRHQLPDATPLRD